MNQTNSTQQNLNEIKLNISKTLTAEIQRQEEKYWYKRFGSFLIGLVNGRKDFVHTLGVAGLSILTFVPILSSLADPSPNALPTGSHDTVNITSITVNGNVMDINASSARSIAPFVTFSVGSQAIVNANVPDSGSAMLIKVTGGSISEIFGGINSIGSIYIANPSGILFGASSQVNVGSLFASTLSISNANFLSGNLVFSNPLGETLGSVVNRGNIKTAPGGVVGLFGGAVENSGSIEAPLGQIHLAVGETISIPVESGIVVDVKVDEALKNKVDGVKDAVLNTGTLSAQAGLVKLQGALQGAFYDSVVNNQGIIQALGIANKNGSIELLGFSEDGQGLIQNSGNINALNDQGIGGKVKVLGDGIILSETSSIDASGKTGGGEILIGGDFQGKNPEVHNAQRTYVENGAVLKTNATESGDGGKVIVWSDEATWFYGDISAKGIDKGGFAEVSGKEFLQARGTYDLSSTSGNFGTLLFDPLNIDINSGTNDGSDPGAGNSVLNSPSGPPATGEVNFLDAPVLGTFTIYESEIEGINANITLEASNTITNNANLTIQNTRSFSATAGNDIVFNAGSGVTTSGGGNIRLTAGDSIQLSNANLSAGAGDITLGAGTGNISGTGTLSGNTLTINTLAGNATQSGAAGGTALNTNINNLAVSTISGNVRINDASGVNINASTLGSSGLQVTATAGGNITQSGAVTANSITLETNGVGSIDLDDFVNNTQSLGLRTEGGDASFRDTNGFTINQANLNTDAVGLAGDLTLIGGNAAGAGNVSQPGVGTSIIVADSLNVTVGTGSINLNQTSSNNDVNQFSATNEVGASSNINYRDVNGFNTGNINAHSGNVTLVAANGGAGAGDIVQTTGTSVQGNTLSLRTGSGEAALLESNNSFTNLQANSSGGSIAYLDLDNINLQTSSVGGTGTLGIGSETGNITQSGALTGGNLVVGTGAVGSITLNNAGNNFTNLTAINTGDVSYTDADSINLGSFTAATPNISNQLNTLLGSNTIEFSVGGNLAVTSSGAITDSGAINVTGTTTLNSNGNSIVLDTAANDFVGTVYAQGSNVTVVDANALNLANVSASGTLDATAGTDLSLSGNVSGQTVSLNATTGNISQSSGTLQGTNLNLNLDGSGVSANIADADFYQVAFNSDGTGTISSVNYTDRDGFVVGASNLGSGHLNLSQNAALISNNLDPAGPGTETTIANSGALSGSGLSLGSSATLTNVDFATVAANGTNLNVSISDTDGLQVLDSNVGAGGALSVTSNTTGANTNGNPLGAENDLALNGNINAGNLTFTALDSAAIPISSITQPVGGIIATNLIVSTQSGSTTISNTSNDITNLTASSNSGTVTYRDANGFDLVSANLNVDGNATLGNLSLEAGGSGNITQTGDITGADNLTLISSTGNATLNNAGNNINSLNATSNGGNINYRDTNGFNVNAADLNADGVGTAGNLTLRAGGSGGITQTGAVTNIRTLNARTASGNITLSNTANDVRRFSVSTNSGNVNFADSDGFSLLNANLDLDNTGSIGDLNLIVDSGSVDQSGAIGAIKARNLSIQTNDATFNLNNVSNDINNLSVSTSSLTPNSNITFFDSDGINITNANVGSGSLNVTSDASGVSIDNNRSTSIGSNTFSLIAQGTNRGINVSGSVEAINGDVNLTAGRGDITQSIGSSLVGDNLNAITVNGNIDLPNALLGLNPQNDFDTVTLNATGGSGSARYYDVDGVRLGASSATNNLVVVSDTQTSADLNGNANSGIRVVGNVAAGNTVNLVALEDGNITNNASGFIAGSNVILEAENGRIGTEANPLQIDANNLSASAERVDIQDVDDVVLATQISLFAAPLSGYPIHLVNNEATVGNYNLDGATTLSGDLTVITSVSAANNVNLNTVLDNSDIIVNGIVGAGNNSNLITNGLDADIFVSTTGNVIALNNANLTTNSNNSGITVDGLVSANNNAILTTNGIDADILVSSTGSVIAINNNVALITNGDSSDITVDGLVGAGNNAFLVTVGNDSNISVAGTVLAVNDVFGLTVGNDADITVDGIIGAGRDAYLTTISNDSEITIGGTVGALRDTFATTFGDNSSITVDGGNVIAGRDANFDTTGDFSAITNDAGNILAVQNINIGSLGDFSGFVNINGANTIAGNDLRIRTNGDGSGVLNIVDSTMLAGDDLRIRTTGDASAILGDSSDFVSGDDMRFLTNGDSSGIVFQNSTNVSAGDDIRIRSMGNNSDITESADSSIIGDQLTVITSDNDASLIGTNNDVNSFETTSNSGYIELNDLNGLDLLASNVGTGSLDVTTSGNLNVLGDQLGGNIYLTTTNNGDINLFDRSLTALADMYITSDGNVKGLSRNQFPKLTAGNYLYVEGDRVGDRANQIPIGLKAPNGLVNDKAAQLGVQFFTRDLWNFLVQDNGFALYPLLNIDDSSNKGIALGQFIGQALIDTTPIGVAIKTSSNLAPSSQGGIFVKTSGAYILYGNSTNESLPFAENYIKASGKTILPIGGESSLEDETEKFIKASGKFIVPGSQQSSYSLEAGSMMPINYASAGTNNGFSNRNSRINNSSIYSIDKENEINYFE
jgi:hypothetical protein